MTREELELQQKDPRNRKWGIFYYCKADPRVIVPKRYPWMGWTINAAQPAAIPVLLFLLTILAGPLSLASALGAGNGIILITGLAALTIVCVICAYLSTRTG